MTGFLVFVAALLFVYMMNRLGNVERELARLKQLGGAQAQQASKPTTINLEHVPVPPAQKPNAGLSAPTPQSNDGLEFKLGAKFFTIVGAVAVLFGIGFFLRYAFEQNLITEVMRVVLGVFTGVVLIGLGEYLKNKFTDYSNVLSGTGIGVLYVSFYSAYNSYKLYPEAAALVLMLCVTVVGAFLAIRANSQRLAGLAQFGGYLTPLLLGMANQNSAALFVYIALLNIGVLLIAMWRTWRGLTLGSLLGTAVVYIAWHANYYSSHAWVMPFVFLTIYFVTFLAVNGYRYFIEHKKSDENDLALVLFNPIFYFLASYAVIFPVNHDYLGPLAFILGAIYLALGMLIDKNNYDAKIFHFGVASILLFVGMPIQFEGQWIAIGWLAEAALLMYYGLFKNLRGMQFLAHVIFMIAVMRIMLVDGITKVGDVAVFNGRGLTFALAVTILGFTAVQVYRRINFNSGLMPDQKNALISKPAGSDVSTVVDYSLEVIVMEIMLLALYWTAAEISAFGKTEVIGPMWSIIGLLAVSTGLVVANKHIRTLGIITGMLATGYVFFFDIWHVYGTSDYSFLLNMRMFAVLGVSVFLLATAVLLRANRNLLNPDEQSLLTKLLFIEINILLFFGLTSEVTNYFTNKMRLSQITGESYRSIENLKRAMISLLWLVYAGALLVLGIARKMSLARIISLSLFVFVIFKVFIYDTSLLSNFYRFVSFFSLGVVLLLAAYLYNKYKERIVDFVKVQDNVQ